MADHRTLKDLAAWYWSAGARRSGQFELSPDWAKSLVDAQSGRMAAREARPSLVLFAQRGVDGPAILRRTLGKATRAFESGQTGGAFDASSPAQSGIAARFTTHPRETSHQPLLLNAEVMTEYELMAACSAGYVLNPDGDATSTRPLSVDDIDAALVSEGEIDTVNPQACQRTIYFLNAMDDLLVSGLSRFEELTKHNIWSRQLGPAVLRASHLRADLNLAETFAFSVLWDGQPSVTETFRNLLDMRSRLLAVSKGRPLVIASPVAHLLTRPISDFVALGSHIDRRDPAKLAKLEETARRLKVRDNDKTAEIVMDEDSDGALCDSLEDLVALQGVIREIVFTLDTKALPPEVPSLGDALQQADLVGAPAPFAHGRLPGCEGADRGQLLGILFQNGKAATYGLGAPEDGCAKAVLWSVELDATSGDAPQAGGTQPVAHAVVGLNRALVDLVSDKEDTPQGETDTDATDTPDDRAKEIKALASLADHVSPIYGIASHDKPFGDLSVEQQDLAAERLARLEPLQAYMRSAEKARFLLSGLVQPDGGVATLLGDLARKLEPREVEGDDPGLLHHELRRLITAARPLTSADGGRHKQAFTILAEAITTYCHAQQRTADRRSAAMRMSEELRRAFSVSAQEIEPLPKQLGADHERASAYLTNQVALWANRSAISRLFDTLQIPETDRSLIVKTMQMLIPADEIALWIINEFSDITAGRQAAHCRRYVAARLTDSLMGAPVMPGSDPLRNADTLQKRLNSWANPTLEVEQSLHYERVVRPMIDRFRQISLQRLSAPWIPQPGDDDIEELAERIES